MSSKKRLIYLEDAKEALTGWETDPTDEEIEYTLDNLPTVDAVEVVRCNKCIHYKPQNQGVHRNCTTPYCVRTTAIKVGPEDFCSFGERRKDDAT